MSSISPSSSIKQLAIRGTLWTILGYGVSQILRFGSNLILTRLLFPEAFGLMTLVYVFIGGLHLFSDLGIGTSIVQNRRGDDATFLNTAWTLQILRGGVLWGACLLLAWPAAQIYSEPQLQVLLPVVGLGTLISSFNSTAVYTLNRHLSVKQVALFELGGQIAGLIVMVIWAYFSKSVWALAIGGLTTSMVQLVWSHGLNAHGPNRLAWDQDSLSEILSFGKWVFATTALMFLATQSDRLLLGKFFPLELLGVYGIAYTLADIPKQIVSAVGGKVVFPTYAKFAELPRPEFRQKVKKVRLLLLLATAPVLALLISFGDILVSLLYDQRYAAAGWMLPILALGIWPVVLNFTLDPVLFAIGKPKCITIACFWSALSLVGGIILGFQFFGPLGAIVAVPFSNIPPYFIVTYGLWKEKLACIEQDFKTTTLFLVTLTALIGVRYLIGLPM